MRLLKAWLKDAGSAPETKYVGVCDGIRVLAICLVAWFHIWQQSWLWPGFTVLGFRVDLDPFIRSGYMGVDFMILLSGFCLWLPWARLEKTEPDPDWRRFYLKRIARIVPSYFLCLVIVFVACLYAGFYSSPTEAARDMFRHMTFTQVFSYDTYYASPLNAALWTIAVEMHFYLLFPLIARAFRRLPVLTAGVMIAAALGYRYWVETNIRDIGIYFNQLAAYLDVFAIGMLTAHLHVRLAGLKRGALIRLLCGIATVLAAYGILQVLRAQSHSANTEAIRLGQMHRRLILACLGAVLILGSANAGAILRHLFSNPVTHFLAGVSMQFYIWHQVMAVQILRGRLIPSAFENPNYEGDAVWQGWYTLACWGGALLVSILLTYGFEKPIARLLLGGQKQRGNKNG